MKKISISLFVAFVFVAAACGPDPLKIRTAVSEAGSNDPTPSAGTPPVGTPPSPVSDAPAPTATDTSSATATATSTVITTPTATVTTTATATQSDTAPITVSQTATATVTTQATMPFSILSVTVDKVDALGNPAEDVRSFGIQFSSPAKDVDLVISTKESGVFHLEHVNYVPGSLYISPGNWAKKLQSNTTYQWSVTANAASPVIGSTSDVVYGEFTTAYCFIGEYKYHYTPDPKTDGVGRCHGAMMECVDSGHGSGMLSGAGEVTPYPWGDIAGNGIDDDCNGIVDDGQVEFCPAGGSTVSEGCCATGGATFMKMSKDYIVPGNLVRGTSFSMVYYISSNGKRYDFPNRDALNSWYAQGDDFYLGTSNACKGVLQLSDDDLASYQIGGNVTVRPATYILKIATDPKQYVVSHGKTLRWLQGDGVAEKLFPGTSVARLRVLPDAFFVMYYMGLQIASSSDFDPAFEFTTDIESEIAVK